MRGLREVDREGERVGKIPVAGRADAGGFSKLVIPRPSSKLIIVPTRPFSQALPD